jgi:hypothetical protein
MRINDFSGGLFTRAHPSLISQTESQVYTNCDNEPGILKPVKLPLETSISSDSYFKWFESEDTLVSFTTETSFAEYDDVLYYANVGELYETLDGINSKAVGVDAPTTAPELTVQSTAGNLTGNYKYIVLTYNSDLDEEGPLSNILYISGLSNEQTLINISWPKLASTDEIRIYRTTAGGSNFYRVYTIDAANWDGSPYNDNSADADIIANPAITLIGNTTLEVLKITDTGYYSEYNLDGTYSYIFTYYDSSTGYETAPSPSAEAVCARNQVRVVGLVTTTDTRIDKFRLYRIGGTLTDYTLVTEIDYVSGFFTYYDNALDETIAGNYICDTFNNLPPPSNFKYLTLSYAMLFGAVGNKLYYSNIAEPAYWPATNFIDFDEVITGIGALQNGLVVFTEYSSYIVTGNSPSTFSKFLLSGEHGCVNHNTIQFVNNTLAWLSHDGVCATNGGQIQLLTLPKLGRYTPVSYNAVVHDSMYFLTTTAGILVVDTRYNICLRTIDLLGYVGKFNDTLYILKNGDTTLSIMNASSSYAQMSYKSPLLTVTGRLSERKTFKDFYISYEGDITIEIFLDGVSIFSKTLDPSKTQFNAKSIGTRDGYGLHYTVVGTGELHELEFNARGRE